MVAQRVRVAAGMMGRLSGLLAAPRLAVGEALWLESCNGIHTFGMRYPIAAIVLDRDGVVIKAIECVPPWRVVWPVRAGYATVEMLPETLSRSPVRPGDRLLME